MVSVTKLELTVFRDVFVLKIKLLVLKHLGQLTNVFENRSWQVYSSTVGFRISMYDRPLTVYFLIKNTNKLFFSTNTRVCKKCALYPVCVLKKPYRVGG